MFLVIFAVFAIGVGTGVSLDQNVPAVTKFGDKHLSGQQVNGYDVVVDGKEVSK